ncbi:bifunctional glycosyltransferase family 2/GtrA family protein [Brachybacterium aquaticum]|uniref:dolichyl-phosphate beta-glucosyltransferase n=1 Tax=Brachybacterium aquaticum TaxID=1432564 RepID=A0A841AFL2_9MICO|nr:bifunctional glycosyltransferase family 2/GtrA family protein [Brachybacterium aquaticum]MBB5832115.1 putative flippase GtrA [Brachybacterium aquaticum]
MSTDARVQTPPAPGTALLPGDAEPGTTVLDVVIPVLNEEHTVGACVRRLEAHLRETFPYPYRITIADNGSTDRTPEVAAELSRELAGRVRVVRLDQKGRGRALQQVWSASDALILAYMDVDLSTDLDALWPLVAPLMSGHSDLAIGTRLHRSSRVVRGMKRELISRSYNLGLSVALGARFSDAQCGFKAIRADVARELLPLVEDTAWFFDTELLVLAERCGLRIHEVPVDWYDDPDSRVDVVRTARDDIAGVVRLAVALHHGDLPVEQIRTRSGRARPRSGTAAQLIRFALVGVLSTVLHLGGFALLSATGLLGSQVANLVALMIATVLNTTMNRSWTFGIRSRRLAWLHQLQGLVILGLTWALSAGALAGLEAAHPDAPVSVQTVVLGGAMVIATLVKFAVMKGWRRAEGE